MGEEALRLLHTSDVHIGGGFRAPEDGEHHEHCLCPLVVIEQLVQTEQADAMLVVGDLFDHQRVSEELVAEVLGRLGNLGVPCVVIAGNHDVHDERTVYEGGLVDRLRRVFLDDDKGSMIELLDGDLTIWGKAMPVQRSRIPAGSRRTGAPKGRCVVGGSWARSP